MGEKGADIFRPKAIEKYPELRRVGFRLIDLIRRNQGRVFYYGRDKISGRLDGNSVGFYTTILAHLIRKLDYICSQEGTNFVLVIDQHSARKELLNFAAKTMYGNEPAKTAQRPQSCAPWPSRVQAGRAVTAAGRLADRSTRGWACQAGSSWRGQS